MKEFVHADQVGLNHVLRSILPWRVDDGLTECGLNAASVSAIPRATLQAQIKTLGRQRVAMLTCMTCLGTSDRHKPWGEDPRLAFRREIDWEISQWGGDNGRGNRSKHELLAIARLIEAHRDEFDRFVAESVGREEWLAKKAASEKVRGH